MTFDSVFIGGCGRSGTTMLGDLLGSIPGAIVTPESGFKIPVINAFKNNGLKAAVKVLKSHFRYKIWGINIDDELLLSAQSIEELFGVIISHYAEKVGVENWRLWVDHTPNNIKYYNVINSSFPSSKYLYIYRDGRAVASSVISRDWGPSNIIDSASWWLENNAIPLSMIYAQVENYYSVKYEDLILRPDYSLGFILDKLNINYPALNLVPGSLKLPSYTKTQHNLVGSDFDISRLNSWEISLTKRQVELFEYVAGGLLSSLGYKRMYDFPMPPSKYELLLMGLWPLRFDIACLNRFYNVLRKLKGIVFN